MRGLPTRQWNDDFGLGWNDYGARFYDPAVARWMSVDPMAEKYNEFTPYCYSIDDPVLMNDIDGKDVDPTNLSKEHQKALY